MSAVIFGYFGTLTGPGTEEYREPLAHRTGELLGGCRPRFQEALAGSFGEHSRLNPAPRAARELVSRRMLSVRSRATGARPLR